MTIEERIQRLEDTEAIRCLQARYQRLLDIHAFDELKDCFTPDAESAYGNGSMSYKGRDAIVDFLRHSLARHITSTHLIHGGEIELVSTTEAHGKWYLEDYLLHNLFLLKLHGAAIYNVAYRKDGDAWKIARIGYERCYEYFEFRPLLNLFTLGKRTFIKKKNR